MRTCTISLGYSSEPSSPPLPSAGLRAPAAYWVLARSGCLFACSTSTPLIPDAHGGRLLPLSYFVFDQFISKFTAHFENMSDPDSLVSELDHPAIHRPIQNVVDLSDVQNGCDGNLDRDKQPDDSVKSIIIDLHKKGKNPKQISAHFSLATYGISESYVVEFIQSHKGVFILLFLSKQIVFNFD
jgi:hypothetical protein